MRPLPIGALLTVIVLIVLVSLFLVGCQSKVQATGIDSAVLRQAAAVDEARLTVSDGSLYQPAFRVLEDRGRLRLIVQDPLTHHYVLVR